MKVLFTIIVTVSSFSCFAQKNPFPVDSASGKINYSDVVQVPNVSAKELYDRAKTFWFRGAKFDSRAIIQVDDPAGGVILAKATMTLVPASSSFLLGGYNKYTVPVEMRFKDGRFRYEITNIITNGVPGGLSDMPIEFTTVEPMTKRSGNVKEKHYQQFNKLNESFLSFIETMKNFMSQPSTASKNDW